MRLADRSAWGPVVDGGICEGRPFRCGRRWRRAAMGRPGLRRTPHRGACRSPAAAKAPAPGPGRDAPLRPTHAPAPCGPARPRPAEPGAPRQRCRQSRRAGREWRGGGQPGWRPGWRVASSHARQKRHRNQERIAQSGCVATQPGIDHRLFATQPGVVDASAAPGPRRARSAKQTRGHGGGGGGVADAHLPQAQQVGAGRIMQRNRWRRRAETLPPGFIAAWASCEIRRVGWSRSIGIELAGPRRRRPRSG